MCTRNPKPVSISTALDHGSMKGGGPLAALMLALPVVTTADEVVTTADEERSLFGRPMVKDEDKDEDEEGTGARSSLREEVEEE